MPSPAISVIMPVYNGETFLQDAINSILDQTFSNFEFIIVNDGSGDNSLEVIKSFNDKRIKIIDLKINIGNYPARNLGISIAKGKYLCVMDSDDISLPHRFKTQSDFLEKEPQIGICGSIVWFLGTQEILDNPLNFEELKVAFLKNNYCAHPTLMMRHSFLKKFNLAYNPRFVFAADYNFVAEALAYFLVVNLPEVLLEYRLHNYQISSQHYTEQQGYADQIRIKQLSNFGITPNANEREVHLTLFKGVTIIDKEKFLILRQWADKLVRQNIINGFYDNDLLIELLRNTLKYLKKYSNFFY